MFRLYLSDKAYQGLVEMGKRQKYIQADTRARGFGIFLQALLRSNPTATDWIDTRPEGMRAFEMEQLEAGVLPDWETLDLRYPHDCGDIPRTLCNQILRTAQHWGTVRTKSQGTQNRFSEGSIISQFFEVVGLGYLTPKYWPEDQARYRRKEKTEWDW